MVLINFKKNGLGNNKLIFTFWISIVYEIFQSMQFATLNMINTFDNDKCILVKLKGEKEKDVNVLVLYIQKPLSTFII